MFNEIWALIQEGLLNLALGKLGALNPDSDYLKSFRKLLIAEVALHLQEFDRAMQLLNEIQVYFATYQTTLENLKSDLSGIQFNFLENCWIYWTFARIHSGRRNWKLAKENCQVALSHWNFYALTRRPFLNFGDKWSYLPIEITHHLNFLNNQLSKKISRGAMLDLLVQEQFTPQPFPLKVNQLQGTTPLVSVCITSYKDEPWLQLNLNFILLFAGYENYEIVLLIYKDEVTDSTDSFLQSEFYKNQPHLKVFHESVYLGPERARLRCYELASGDLIISLDADVIPCHHFIPKAVKIFLENPEVSLLSFGLSTILENGDLTSGYFFNEIPKTLDGFMGIKRLTQVDMSPFHKTGLYLRQTLQGTAFCITRRLLKEIGGFLINRHPFGERALGMSAYMYGYPIFMSPELVCIHKSDPSQINCWQNPHLLIKQREFPNEIPLGALCLGYFYFSQNYFQTYHVPWIQQLCGNAFFDVQWKKFHELQPALFESKKLFWQGAVRSMREYWLEYWDPIWWQLSESERETLCEFIDY